MRNYEQLARIEHEAKLAREYSFDNYNYLVDIKVKIDQILKNQQEEIFKAHDLVIIYDGVNSIKVYENGRDITEGIERLTLEAGRPPRIEYDKVL